ncbi:hypothetical protein [Epilithonimonas hispanica]|uniref:Uncharacterized protein n=1 Tax=Epilithonimonas hispanica TaxID=358687 RepID=A0A3D9D2J6_9FLAO|nr:hypothetical protein [Epilithonimonas hispanica]REC72121.1 hypothetical protein DRF58_04005 [Epilithonimonas hispanica]
MSDTEFLHFQSLKKAVQDKYLETHSPAYDDISKWKGIDIIYFQEDLRQKAKGNISEKTFYTYFKNNSQEKIPRIDMLNILAVYSGYSSWSDFKKKNPIITTEQRAVIEPKTTIETESQVSEIIKIEESNLSEKITKPLVSIDNQAFDEINQNINFKSEKQSFLRGYLWLGISAFLFAVVLVLIFYDNLFYKKYTYAFTDADRNSSIKGELDVKIIRENESPILFKVKPNSPFVYETKSKSLKMVISSPFYRTDVVTRDLTNAPESENIELKPNDYAIQLYYYSKSIIDFKKKTSELNRLISDNALIYQVVDSDIYGIETLDKQKYISLVTLPTTSLEKLEVIDSQMKNGKIVMIRFKITDDEKSK